MKTEGLFEQTEKKEFDFGSQIIRGYRMDEVVSALQKDIRRGNEKEAAYWAYLIHEAGYYKYLFSRLVVIAFEDIGKANLPLVQLVVETANFVQTLKRPPEGLIATGIVSLMARSPKCREADELHNLIGRMVKENPLPMPDYAVDMHTQRGKEMGRGLKYFWEEGAKLKNEIPSEYKEELYQKLGYKMPDEP